MHSLNCPTIAKCHIRFCTMHKFFFQNDFLGHSQFKSSSNLSTLFNILRVCAGMRGYARVCTGVHGCERVCAGMRGYVLMCAGGVRGCAGVCVGVREYSLVCVG